MDSLLIVNIETDHPCFCQPHKVTWPHTTTARLKAKKQLNWFCLKSSFPALIVPLWTIDLPKLWHQTRDLFCWPQQEVDFNTFNIAEAVIRELSKGGELRIITGTNTRFMLNLLQGTNTRPMLNLLPGNFLTDDPKKVVYKQKSNLLFH